MSDGSPPDNHPSARIFISAAEPSGDRHAAGVIREIRKRRPESRFVGVAGPLMQQAGCEPIDDLTGRSAMLLGAVRLAGRAYRLLKRTDRLLRDQRVGLAILVDSPALHLPMAKRVKKAGTPVLYYVAPQLWAWAPWRIRRLRRRVDRVAAILPFEEEYFRQRGVDTHFVGHPLIEQLTARTPDADMIRDLKQTGSPIVACLPGSRGHVVREVLPGQIAVARAIAACHPQAAFLFAAAHQAAALAILSALAEEQFTSRVLIDQNAEILAAAELALCASGTATLEVAYAKLPMVVMYNGSKWGYRLVGRWLIRTPHLCLVNILAGRRIVPEFMPYYTSTEPIAREAIDLLTNPQRRADMTHDLEAVIQSLGTSSAAQTTAEMAIDMLA
jgi:lipid-A-disaccharide synthase